MLYSWNKGFLYEYRAFAGIDVSNHIAQGINIYKTNAIASANQPLVYLYPIIQPLLAAMISSLPFISTIDAHYIIAFGSLFGMILLFAKITRRNQIQLWLIVAGEILLATISSSSRFYPGALALTLSFFIFDNIDLNLRFSSLLNALLLYLLFFTKQYFIVYIIPIFVYYIIQKEFKKSCSFLLWIVFFGIIALIITKIFFPNYFLNTIFITKYSTGISIKHLISQLIVMWQQYGLIICFVILFCVAYWKLNDSKKDVGHLVLFCMITFVCNLGMSLYFSTNDGARYTYIQELCLPSLTLLLVLLINRVLFTEPLFNIHGSNEVYRTLLIWLVPITLAFSLFQIGLWRKESRVIDDQLEGINEIRKIVQIATAMGESVFLSPDVAHLSMEYNNANIYFDNGQLEFATSDRLKNEGILGKLYYQKALEETVYVDNFVDKINRKIDDQQIGVIVLSDNEPLLKRESVEKSYELLDEVTVRSCVNSYNDQIWIRKGLNIEGSLK